MMYERLTVNISKAEMDALRAVAQRELRRPRDQARLILRDALIPRLAGTDPGMAKNESGATVTSPAAAL